MNVQEALHWTCSFGHCSFSFFSHAFSSEYIIHHQRVRW